MSDASIVQAYDAPDEGDAGSTQDLYPTFEVLDGPEPLTIDGHRLVDDIVDDD